jgi:hypothetical protein
MNVISFGIGAAPPVTITDTDILALPGAENNAGAKTFRLRLKNRPMPVII